MNVDDISNDTIPIPTSEKDRLDLIFERQRTLMVKYEKIEQQNGLLETPHVPVDLHDRFGQARLKNFAWRVVEELTEATAARQDHPGLDQHFFEEISDAYHFLIELNILSGLNSESWSKDFWPSELKDKLERMFNEASDNSIDIYPTIERLGRAMNALKNKPWKVTHMLTDIYYYHHWLKEANWSFINFCRSNGFTADSLFRMYFKKSEVNMFRQRSAY